MAVDLVGQKELQRRQKKGPEPPFFLLGTIEISPFQHADEELLREILGLVRRILTNLGCIDQNPWMSRVGSFDSPDFILIDLDPMECPYDRIVEAALLLYDKPERIGLRRTL